MATTSPDEFHRHNLSNDPPLTPIKKPPLGLIPQKIRQEQRLQEIGDAIRRYLKDGDTTIPSEWIAEYNALVVGLRRL